MKMKKGLGILLAAGLVLTTVTPCVAAEDVTADALIDGYIQKNEDFQSISGVERIALSMNMAMMGQEMDMKMDMVMDIESTKDISHVFGDMNMVQTGTGEEDMEESMKTEMYSVREDDGSYTLYSLDSDTGSWSVSSLDEVQFNMDLSNLIRGDGFVLSDGTVDVDGVECYEVIGSMALADMMEYIGNSMEGLGEILPLDDPEAAEAYKLDVFYYFNTENKELYSMKMDGSEMMEELFMDAIEKSFAEMGTEGEEDSDFDMSALLALFQIDISEFVVEVSNIEFDTVDSIVIPDEVLAA